MNLTFGIVTSAALLDSLNPCAISVLLLTTAFLLSNGKSRSEVFKLGLVYIASLYLVYLFIGLGVLQALSFFGITNAIAKLGATILAITASINLMGYFFPNFPIKLKIPKFTHPLLAKHIEGSRIGSAAILGILVGLFEFPCTGGPYLSILSLLHSEAKVFSGLIYLLYYNFVFVLPLIIILFLSNSSLAVSKLNQMRKSHSKKIDLVTSILMLVLSAIIFLTI